MKSIILLSVLLSQVCWGFLFNEVDRQDTLELYKHIKNNNVAGVEDILDGKSKSGDQGEISKGFGHYLLGLATNRSNWGYSDKLEISRYYCAPEIVAYLIEHGAKPSENTKIYTLQSKIQLGHLTGAVRSMCPQSVEALLPYFSPEEIAKATKEWSMFKHRKMVNDKVIAPRIANTAKVLATKNKENCKANGDQSSGCRAVDHIRAEIKIQTNWEASQRYKETPEGIEQKLANTVCLHYLDMNLYKSWVDEEAARGKMSGFVNATKMKEWGDLAYNEKKAIKRSISNYEGKIGKKFDLNRCK